MVQGNQESPSRGFTVDPLTEVLVPDPAEVPEVRVLAGLCAESDRRGYHRVYLAIDLSEYVEFRASDFVHQEPARESPAGGSFVWVKASAELRRVYVGARGAQREYLKPYGSWTYFCPPWVTCPPQRVPETPQCWGVKETPQCAEAQETPWCPMTPRCAQGTPRCPTTPDCPRD